MVDLEQTVTLDVTVTLEDLVNTIAYHGDFSVLDMLDAYMALRHGDEQFISEVRQMCDKWEAEIKTRRETETQRMEDLKELWRMIHKPRVK